MNIINLILWLILLALQVMDVLTTNRALALGGVEANPLVRWVMSKTDGLWWLVAKSGVVMLSLSLALKDTWVSAAGLGVVDALYVWVVVQNLRLIRRIEQEVA